MKQSSTTKQTKLILALFFFAALPGSLKAQVTIGSNTTPNSNAVLDLISNANKGLLLPRVALSSTTSSSPLSSHVAGMLVYNTATNGSGATAVSPGIYYNNGSAWLSTISAISNIYNTNGTLTDNRVVTLGGRALNFADGNVGIGNAIPLAKLDILGGAGYDGSNNPKAMAFQYNGGGYRHWISTRHNSAANVNSNAIDFYLNNSSNATGSSAPGTGSVLGMSVTATGVGIGTTSPNYKLHVNGDVGAYTYNCISDIRLKKDIKPLETNNQQVLKIRPVTYILKEDPEQLRRTGVIAQELETLFPDLVKTGQNGYKAVEYDKISLLLLSVVKKQQKDIEQMNEKLKKLEEKIK